ncbi:uncharacterized protein DUF1761 [Roseibium hamelinense]|uniref:Uncharacterized protein DUF1761 n=1 Tax=Roseibium hamelinense TaxID=150831 RepID=A0A562SN96_9HYPH|nr:DUF1761 domain-containing protein [Roseibium hamelinense]MTI44002.1 DUF1761 domain-containing protein [Roseibium hamelinense]TWI82791.1 uncharacterized protein DUF1761 [Roseibium hamelinense]
MMYDGINLIGAFVAAVGSFVFGALWYGLLGKTWTKAANLKADETKPAISTMAIAFFCQFVMAFVFAGVIYHVAGTSVRTGLISAIMLGVGIIFPTLIANHRFQNQPWTLTFIDGGHWIGVLLVQGVLIGLVGDFPA